MKTKLFKQVHASVNGHYFRLTLPVAKFQSDERWADAKDAAFFADVFKLYLVKRFTLSGNTMFPSLDPETFTALLGEVGIDRTSPDSLFDALPQSCKVFLSDGGHELLTAHQANRNKMNRVIS